MQLTDSDIAAIREWANDHPEKIAEVWLYGSRARGSSSDVSDIDLAVVTVGDTVAERQICWTIDTDWIAALKLSHEVDLEWYDHEAEGLEYVGSGVRQDGIRLWPCRPVAK